jgi:serine protein kinase
MTDARDKPDVREELDRIRDRVRTNFDAQKRVLSFREYVDQLLIHPERLVRDASRYTLDAVDHFGSYGVTRFGEARRRWRVFDLDFGAGVADGGRREFLVGQEAIQEAFYRELGHFAQQGRANRLLLMYGPNGSAKTTFVQCLMRALEVYSTLDEGALYRFAWIFPRARDGKSIGFGTLDDDSRAGGYAHLPESQVDAKLAGELREHPLHLLPIAERRQLLESVPMNVRPPDWIWNGQLSQRNQRIYDALLTAYRGDIDRVLDHVRVERYYISRHYRVGAVTVGPEMAVDASERQITADHSLGALPASLASLTLFEPYGELVNAASGIIEYSDLLKRPLDAWKYLLLAIEHGEVSLPMSNLTLNSVMVASSNEIHMRAFREHPDYNSFRGRMQLVRVPYLLDYTQEQAIYDSQIVPQVRKHVAPHSTFVTALWAVLTRLRRPQPDGYVSSTLGRVAADLTPLEKARLYARGVVPGRFSSDEARELAAGVPAIVQEAASSDRYEGLEGASPREIRGIVLDAASSERHECLSPLAVLEALDAFVERSDHDFLRQTPDKGYHDHREFIAVVRECWLDRVDIELRASTGLVEDQQYLDAFVRYVTQVSVWLKGEKVRNTVTGNDEEPDAELMDKVEFMLGVTKRSREFRNEIISKVAAYAIDHPGEKSDPAKLFPQHVDRMREAYFEEKRDVVAEMIADGLAALAGRPAEGDRGKRAAHLVAQLELQFGYTKASASVALSEIHRQRYS